MTSGRSTALACAEFDTVDALPAAARDLFGGDFFSSLAWYRTMIAFGMPDGARAALLVVSAGDAVRAVFPMCVAGRRAGSLTSAYSCRWRPLLAPGLPPAEADAVWRAFSQWCRGFASVRLEALDDADAASVRAPGMVALRFDHFGNWHEILPHGWPAYLAARPGPVRESVRRRGKKLTASGAVFRVVCAPAEVDAGIAAYEDVYARSWKIAEPWPAFNPALMRACAGDGSLRLGLLTLDGAVLAAQFWVVRDGWASVLKLAHDEAAKALAPGTVLTAWMIERLMDLDGVTELDFGRGDDAYKAGWAAARRQRHGIVLANPRTAAGSIVIARHHVGRAVRNLPRFMHERPNP